MFFSSESSALASAVHILCTWFLSPDRNVNVVMSNVCVCRPLKNVEGGRDDEKGGERRVCCTHQSCGQGSVRQDVQLDRKPVYVLASLAKSSKVTLEVSSLEQEGAPGVESAVKGK